MQLLQRPQGQVVEGEIRLNLGSKAYDVTKAPDSVMQHLRGNYISMIFQEPMTALNPVFRIGDQVDEVLALHNEKGHDEAQIKRAPLSSLKWSALPTARAFTRCSRTSSPVVCASA